MLIMKSQTCGQPKKKKEEWRASQKKKKSGGPAKKKRKVEGQPNGLKKKSKI